MSREGNKRPASASASISAGIMNVSEEEKAREKRAMRAFDALLKARPDLSGLLRRGNDAAIWAELEPCIVAQDGLQSELAALAVAFDMDVRSKSIELAKKVAQTQP